MPKPQPLKVNIARPCQQNWGAMEQKDKGRYCQECKKVVVDFTGLTDEALYNYFQNAATIPCGRFHNDQLNRSIPPPPKRLFYSKRFYKAAIAVFTFLNMKNAVASPTGHTTPVEITPLKKIPGKMPLPNKVTITGTVKDPSGSAIENASITIDSELVAKTDKEGKFQFELDLQKYKAGKSVLLLINYPGMNTVVRNYNPAMSSTSYDIILSPRLPMNYSDSGTMGIIYVDSLQPMLLNINPGTQSLTKSIQDSLTKMAIKLRNAPELKLYIVAYPKDHEEKTKRGKLQSAIKSFLLDSEGIDDSRLIIIFGKYSPGKRNIIQLTSEEE